MIFQELNVLVDKEGRFIFLHCKLCELCCIIAVVYIPPPFSSKVLQILLVYLLVKRDFPLLLIGGLNCYFHPLLDKYPPSQVYRFMQEGWIDFWRTTHPQEKQFSCLFKSHMPLFRIDLGLGTPSLPPYHSSITYHLRGIAVHSPLMIHLAVKPKMSLLPALWKLNTFWLNFFPHMTLYTTTLLNFWQQIRTKLIYCKAGMLLKQSYEQCL